MSNNKQTAAKCLNFKTLLSRLVVELESLEKKGVGGKQKHETKQNQGKSLSLRHQPSVKHKSSVNKCRGGREAGKENTKKEETLNK